MLLPENSRIKLFQIVSNLKKSENLSAETSLLSKKEGGEEESNLSSNKVRYFIIFYTYMYICVYVYICINIYVYTYKYIYM
jgi:hypothetical protein